MSRDSYSAKASSQEKVSLIRPPRPRLAQACGRKINGNTGMAGPLYQVAMTNEPGLVLRCAIRKRFAYLLRSKGSNGPVGTFGKGVD